MISAHFRHLAAFALLLAAAPALAQQPAPAPVDQPAADQAPAQEPSIVVTGERPDDLVVDVRRIAQRCIACRRAVQSLRAVAVRAGARPRLSPRMKGFDPPDLSGNAGVDYYSGSSPDHRRPVHGATEMSVGATRAIDRTQASGGAERFTANLLELVEPIVERIRQERGADAVYEPGDPEARGRRLADITDAVIEALDREHAGADLLVPAR